MKKAIIYAALIAAVFAVACGKEKNPSGSGDIKATNTPTSAPKADLSQPAPTEAAQDSTPAEQQNETPDNSDPGLLNRKICEFLISEVGQYFDEAEYCIPCPILVDVEEDDENIDIYGIFWLLNYKLEDRKLVNVSGGSFPGVIHGKFTADGFELTDMERVEQGMGYADSAKRIFGDKYETYSKMISSDEIRESYIKQSIDDYAKEHGLDLE